MGDAVTSHAALEVSVSFGRFENDSLSWEKWSSFSPNKYLEEVEKCATPGSVAQKKAYFEAHYKKIAARKAEMLEQENMMETDSSRSGETNPVDCVDRISSSSVADAECGIFRGPNSAEEVEEDANSSNAVSSSFVDEAVEDGGDALECQELLVESDKEGVNGQSQTNEVSSPEETDLVTEAIPTKPQEDLKTDELSLKVDSETISLQESKQENSELETEKTSQKVTQNQKERNLRQIMKDKPTSTKASKMSTPRTPKLLKPALTSTPKLSKPVSTSTPRSSKPVTTSTPRSSKPITTSNPRLSRSTAALTPRLPKPISSPAAVYVSRSSMKNLNVSSSSSSKSYSSPVIKRSAPASLHMSLSLGPSNSHSDNLAMTRKSLIMEQMGDKDIVRRAFKSFQNNSSQLRPTDDKSRVPKLISARGSEKNVSTSQKENERTRKATEKITQRSQLGTKWNTTSSRSLNETRVEKNVKAAPSSVGLRSNERAEKRKEFLRGLEEKSWARKEEKARHSLKSEEGSKKKIDGRAE